MSNLVIVAIPDENDPVWKISSEKVPHLTVLFLGDVDKVANLESVIGFVEHAASQTLRRFYLPVDHRGELGADNADVLFFKKGRYDYKAIRDFRASLLQDNNIKTAYDSSTQFDGVWQPHLTLGYPASPAKPYDDGQNYRLYDVCFNKISVWTGDFEGFDILLKDYEDEFNALENVPMDVAMSDIQHYGTKGMKWGVRNNTSGAGETKREGVQRFLDPQGHDLGSDIAKIGVGVLIPIVSPLTIPAQVRAIRGGARGLQARSLHKEEEKFTKHAQQASNFVAIHNGAGDRINREIGGINKKYSEAAMKDPAQKKKYDAEVLKLMQDSYRESANSLTNKRATMHLDVSFHGNDGMDVKIVAKKGAPTPMLDRVKHAADDSEDTITFSAKIKRDSNGYIVGFDFEDFEQESMSQSAIELADEFMLEHYGVKGMHWGVCQHRSIETQAHVDSGLLRRRTKVRATGGEAHPAHDDAVKAAIQKQKLKKSGTDALSTQELRELANRLQVENQVAILTSSKGKQFVSKQLEEEGKSALKRGAKSGIKRAGPTVVKKASKGAATAATTAALAL